MQEFFGVTMMNDPNSFHTMENEMVFCYCEKKIVLVIENFFWNLRLKSENFQKFWDQ